MANLIVDPQPLHGLAGKVGATTDEFRTSLDKVINYNTELKDVWKGKDIDAYSARVTEQAAEMDKFYKTLTEIRSFMDKTATDYENAQNTNQSMVNR